MRPQYKTYLLLLLATFALTLQQDAAAQEQVMIPFYRETFHHCGRSGSNSAQDLTGWAAVRKGKLVSDGGDLKVSPAGSPNRFFPINANITGFRRGGVLWTKPTTGLTVFTKEFPFDIGIITEVSYEQRLDGLDASSTASNPRDGSRLAFFIEGTWYISDKIFKVSKRSQWETVKVNPAELTYGTIAGDLEHGPNTPQNSGMTLPQSALMTGFGFYFPRVNGRVRVDNVTLRSPFLFNFIQTEQAAAAAEIVPAEDNTDDSFENESEAPIACICRRNPSLLANFFRLSPKQQAVAGLLCLSR